MTKSKLTNLISVLPRRGRGKFVSVYRASSSVLNLLQKRNLWCYQSESKTKIRDDLTDLIDYDMCCGGDPKQNLVQYLLWLYKKSLAENQSGDIGHFSSCSNSQWAHLHILNSLSSESTKLYSCSAPCTCNRRAVHVTVALCGLRYGCQSKHEERYIAASL